MKKKSKNKTFYVEGMHCSSCEVLLEKKLSKFEQVKSVNASLKKKTLEVTYKGSEAISANELNNEFKDLGYKFSDSKISSQPTNLISFSNGRLVLNKSVLQKYVNIFIAIVLIFGAFFLIESFHLGKYVSVDSSSSLPAFFMLGIVAGLSSCAALIGGLLLSMSKAWNELYIDSDSTIQKANPHILFHVGRLLSFALFGGILGLLSETVSLSNTYFYAILTIVVSIIMFILALQMIGVEWAEKIKIGLPKGLTKSAVNEDNFRGKIMPFVVGGVTFFLPCGFTLIAQSLALTSGSFITGSAIMTMFALGTFPTLLGISYSGLAFTKKPELTSKFNLIAGIVVIFFAIYNINGQLNVLGLQSLSDISFGSSQESSTQQSFVDINDNGIQELNIIADDFEYRSVGSTNLKAGVPAILVVDNKGIEGCGVAMASTGLIKNYVWLDPGINRIDIGSPKKGTYKITCSMGMVPPLTIKVI